MMESVTGSPVADASRQAESTAASTCSAATGSSRATMNAILRSHPVGGSADLQWRRGVVGAAGVAAVTGHGAGGADAF